MTAASWIVYSVYIASPVLATRQFRFPHFVCSHPVSCLRTMEVVAVVTAGITFATALKDVIDVAMRLKASFDSVSA